MPGAMIHGMSSAYRDRLALSLYVAAAAGGFVALLATGVFLGDRSDFPFPLLAFVASLFWLGGCVSRAETMRQRARTRRQDQDSS